MQARVQNDRLATIRAAFPKEGLFAEKEWLLSPDPFPIDKKFLSELEQLGHRLFVFQRACNQLYQQSVKGKQPAWIARYLDAGKPKELIEFSRRKEIRDDLPRVIRPDLILTEKDYIIAEIDSVPGGIGLTGWLNQTYSTFDGEIIGGVDGMLDGFRTVLPNGGDIVLSRESATYRPEMEWVAAQLDGRFTVRDSQFKDFAEGEAVYRFFELFDLPNVPNAKRIFELASEKKIRLTPPPKPMFEEKMLFALLWNRNLQNFWRQELGEGFLARLKKVIPYTWLVDPTPLPPHAAMPGLELTDWSQLKALSQKERDLILKVSGFSENAWGARGVYLGSDLSQADWSAAVDAALNNFESSPSVLQRFHKPTQVDMSWFDFAKNDVVPMKGRARLCPYYFVSGEGDAARPQLGGVLATIVPADKKIVHGMADAVLAPCSA